MAFAFDAVEDCVILFVRKGIYPSELCVEVGGCFGDIGEGVVYLVVEGHALVVDVCHGDFAALAEGHNPVAVEAAFWVYTYGEGIDLCVFAESAGEEVADGTFDGGVVFAVVVEAEDGEAIVAGWCHPDVLDGAGAGDICHCEGLSRFDVDVWVYLPALAELSGGVGGGTLFECCHASFAFLAGEVFGADGACLCV